MLISKFSRDGKSGFAVGSNNLTPEKISAGLITAASGLIIAAVGGLLSIPKKKSPRAGAAKKNTKKRPALLLLLPFIYKHAKTAVKKKGLDGIVKVTVDENVPKEPPESGIEVINAIPISSEDEVYEHI